MKNAIRLLIVDDSPDDASRVEAALRSAGVSFEAERVNDAAGLRAALARGDRDAVTCDGSRLDVLSVVAELGLDVPVLVVSKPLGDEAVADAMRLGARDFVSKDNLARLAPALERELHAAAERKARRAGGAEHPAEARLRRLGESGLMGIVIGEADGPIVEANDAFLEMIGYSRADLAAGAIDWKRLTPPEWEGWNLAVAEELRRHGAARPSEKELFRKDGTRVPVLVGVALLEPPHSVSVSIDLTDRKRTEEALRQSERQLRQAQKMEAVGRLAGGVAHDFNNVLSVILSYAEILIGDVAPNDPMRADLEEIQKAARRATDLTRQLLMFSRQHVSAPKVLDLNEVIATMDKMLRRVLGEDVEVISRPGAALGAVRVDPSSIEQVIMNLVVNARDAMPTGGKLTMETANVELDDAYVSAHPGAKPGPYVMLAIADTGIGIEKATLSRIFEPFFTTKETGKGTGLGLSTVFGIVEQSGGSVSVESEPGVGTTMRVYLPRVESDVVRSPSRPPPSPASTATILLVEDEDQVRAVATSILKRLGYRIIEARNAGDALLICEAHKGPIDLLLTDVVMPNMSGPQLALRLQKTRPTMKVLCMSGYTDDSIVRHGVLDAAIDFLQKPITPQSLKAKVREVLDAPLRPPAK